MNSRPGTSCSSWANTSGNSRRSRPRSNGRWPSRTCANWAITPGLGVMNFEPYLHEIKARHRRRDLDRAGIFSAAGEDRGVGGRGVRSDGSFDAGGGIAGIGELVWLRARPAPAVVASRAEDSISGRPGRSPAVARTPARRRRPNGRDRRISSRQSSRRRKHNGRLQRGLTRSDTHDTLPMPGLG